LPAAETSSFAAERARLEPILREAGELALRLFRTDLRQWTKDMSSPVSEADIAVNDLLRDRLAAAFPDDAWLSEESDDDPARLGARRVWVIDPIDGTRAYLAGRTDWCLSAALVVDTRPVAGFLYAPALAQFFTAERDAGAFVNGAPIRASARAGLSGATIAAPAPLIEGLDLAAAGVQPIPRIGSLALRLARVAEGAIDGTLVRPDSHDWDLAAADVLVHEAGGLLTGASGAPVVYNRPGARHGLLVGAGRAVHGQLLGRLQSLGA